MKSIPTVGLRLMPISNITFSFFNPHSRTTLLATKSLRKDIKKYGILSPAHLYHAPRSGFNNVCVDGHRRCAAAIELGITHIQCVFHSQGSPAELWVVLNRGTRPISNLDWMEAWFLEKRLDEFIPRPQKKAIGKCMEIFGGRAGIQYLINKRTAPGVAAQIIPIYNAFMDLRKAKPLALKQVGEWVVEHKLQQSLKFLCKAGWGGTVGLQRLWVRARDNQAFGLDEFVPQTAPRII